MEDVDSGVDVERVVKVVLVVLSGVVVDVERVVPLKFQIELTT